jgi:hydrogenase maturation protease
VIPAVAGERLLVVGFGNPLMADDGFGSAVVDSLRRKALPRSVSVAAVPDILHLPAVWQGQPEVWMIDAVERGAPPGTLHLLDHDEVMRLRAHGWSTHHLDFGSGLRWLLHANQNLRAVRFMLWGAEPARVSTGQGLSRQVVAAVNSAANEIRFLADRCAANGAGEMSSMAP